jgi:hypothetical protein
MALPPIHLPRLQELRSFVGVLAGMVFGLDLQQSVDNMIVLDSASDVVDAD